VTLEGRSRRESRRREVEYHHHSIPRAASLSGNMKVKAKVRARDSYALHEKCQDMILSLGAAV
jgi:hypothetical protein